MKEKIYFRNLDSIRFFAALMVFLAHGLSECYQYLPFQNTVWNKLLQTISTGGTGVSIFFVLSGFLITYLLISEYELTNRISVKNFYMRRVLRIWPLYYLIVFFSFVIYPFIKTYLGVNNPLASNFLYHLVFLSNFDVLNIHHNFPGQNAMSQNITWSVSVEEQFYLFWPLIFAFIPRKLWSYTILFVIIASFAFRIYNYDAKMVLEFHTLSVLLDLGMGGMFAYLIKKNQAIREYFEGVSTKTHMVFFLFSFLLLFYGSSIFAFPEGKAIARLFTTFSFALIISAQAMTKSQSFLNLGNLSFPNAWGKYTYGIYLIHPVGLLLVNIIFQKAGIATDDFTSVFMMSMIAFILTLILSKLSYHYFELRFLRLKNKFSIIKTNP